MANQGGQTNGGPSGQKSQSRGSGEKRGFASMDEHKQRQIASKGGQSVPDEKRSFSQDHQLAAEAGRKGGQSVPDEKRSFSQDRALASQAGRKGGEARSASRARRAQSQGQSHNGHQPTNR